MIGNLDTQRRKEVNDLADGLLKDEEIYNIFDTEKILNRPVTVTVNAHAGLAGLALWVNNYFQREGDLRIDKKDPGIAALKAWVDRQYAAGRVTALGDEELESAFKSVAPELYTELHRPQPAR